MAAASSVSTTPEPELVSHFEGRTTSTPSTIRHASVTAPAKKDDKGRRTPTSVDDHGVHMPTNATTPETADDHGVHTPTSVDDHGTDVTVATTATTAVTFDDHGTDTTVKTPASTPTTVDDHGGKKGKSGSDDGPTHH